MKLCLLNRELIGNRIGTASAPFDRTLYSCPWNMARISASREASISRDSFMSQAANALQFASDSRSQRNRIS